MVIAILTVKQSRYLHLLLKMATQLSDHIPEKAAIAVLNLLTEHTVNIKITGHRSSKHGDFRKLQNGEFQITVNGDLNKYHFLLTLVHEIAHLRTYLQKKRHKPHGIEWKRNFQRLMLPFLNPEIFPNDLLPHLAKHLKNPRASTGTDTNLTYALKQHDAHSEKHFIFEIPEGSLFRFKNKNYIKGSLRRTRFECVQVDSKKKYLFNKNAQVKALE